MLILGIIFLIGIVFYFGSKAISGKKPYQLHPDVKISVARELRVVFSDLTAAQADSIATLFVKKLGENPEVLAKLVSAGKAFRTSRLMQFGGRDISEMNLTPDELALVRNVQETRAELLPILKLSWPPNLGHMWNEYSETDQPAVMMAVWNRVSVSL